MLNLHGTAPRVAVERAVAYPFKRAHAPEVTPDPCRVCGQKLVDCQCFNEYKTHAVTNKK
jgi:hypothetical protein